MNPVLLHTLQAHLELQKDRLVIRTKMAMKWTVVGHSKSLELEEIRDVTNHNRNLVESVISHTRSQLNVVLQEVNPGPKVMTVNRTEERMLGTVQLLAKMTLF